jgi:hypothetical protein
MATLHADLGISDETARMLKRMSVSTRVVTLRELAADLNARADALEAAGRVEERTVNHLYVDGKRRDDTVKTNAENAVIV